MVTFLLIDKSAAGQRDGAGNCEGNRVTIIRDPERLTQRTRAAVICVSTVMVAACAGITLTQNRTVLRIASCFRLTLLRI